MEKIGDEETNVSEIMKGKVSGSYTEKMRWVCEALDKTPRKSAVGAKKTAGRWQIRVPCKLLNYVY